MTSRNLTHAIIAASLIAAIVAVYGQTLRHDFINFDDPLFVTENPIVQQGITAESLRWSLSANAANWHPLTFWSHLLDVELYGLWSGGHHLTNVMFHALNALLVYAFLVMTTRAVASSALVAFLFALHPLHVESVAWIAERKDVLSCAFWMITVIAYARYAAARTLPRYLLVLLAFALAAMTKPMVVTLPFVLLLLDYWPLRRMDGDTIRTKKAWLLVLEKTPLFAIAVALAAVTFLTQQSSGAVESMDVSPLSARVVFALAAYAEYFRSTFWPFGLAPFYPRPLHSLPWLMAAAGLIVLLTMTTLAFAKRRSAPWFVVGWLWFVGTLVPVIGILQVGAQTHADRYTYIPHIGLFMAIAWSIPERAPKRVFAIASVLICAALGIVAWLQTGYWRDSETLFTHTLRVTEDNARAHVFLGDALFKSGRVEESIPHFVQAAELEPGNYRARFNLGLALQNRGETEAARAQFLLAVQADPDHAGSWRQLGLIELDRNDAIAAVPFLQRAIESDPKDVAARLNLAMALAASNRTEEAEIEFVKTIQLSRRFSDAYYNYAQFLLSQNRLQEAVDQLLEYDRFAPNDPEVLQQISSTYQRIGDPDKAREYTMRLEHSRQ